MKAAGSTRESHEVPWIEFADLVKLSHSLPYQRFGTGQAGTILSLLGQSDPEDS